MFFRTKMEVNFGTSRLNGHATKENSKPVKTDVTGIRIERRKTWRNNLRSKEIHDWRQNWKACVYFIRVTAFVKYTGRKEAFEIWWHKTILRVKQPIKDKMKMFLKGCEDNKIYRETWLGEGSVLGAYFGINEVSLNAGTSLNVDYMKQRWINYHSSCTMTWTTLMVGNNDKSISKRNKNKIE